MLYCQLEPGALVERAGHHRGVTARVTIEIVLDCLLDAGNVRVRSPGGEGRQDKYEWENQESAFHSSAPFERVGVPFR